ncbi:MAG TPA: activator-dependent family glycosyltransferase [Amycolatopsis sp.]|nr:activator-dependent family glycosyltransferase [Amycolatopsis sp.]
MRVIFTSFALDAHFLGQVPLAWALRCAGHEVRIASQPALTESITSAGLTAVPVGADHAWHEAMTGADNPDWDVTLDLDPARPETHHPDLVRAVATEMTTRFFARANNDSMIDDLVAFARAWRPDLVVWEPFTPAGAVAAAVTGAAHARLLWGADLVVDQRNALLRLPGPDPLADWLGGVGERYGLMFDEQLVRGQWTIDQMPASIRLPLGEPTLPMRYVPYNGPAVVPDWLREPPRRPRVCLTVGISERHGANFVEVTLPKLLESVADLDAEIVATVSASARTRIPALPENVRAVEFVPLHVLLPTCSAILHHGGAGTWATAVSAGVPQLIFPSVWDNAYRARRTEELGAGLVVPATEATPATLRDGLARLLTESSFADGAERLRRELLADPAPADVVPRLEKLVLEHRQAGL